MIRLVLWKWMASFPCRAILLFFRIILSYRLPSSTPLLCESTRIDTHVDLSFGNERRKPPHNWPLAAVLGKIWGHLSITTSRLDSSPLSSSHSFEDIKPNGQSLLCSTKLNFFNSSSRRILTRGQPWGKSLKWCDGLTYYFGRPGAILTYLDIEAQHCPRASWIDCVWHNNSCVSCATILEQFETDNRRSITRCMYMYCSSFSAQERTDYTETVSLWCDVWTDSNSNRAGANLVSADWTLPGKHCTRDSAQQRK